MNSVASANQEEAAAIAAEFLASLDNLPNEVQHLLAEIRHKETRSHELQQEISKLTDRYFRHALRNLNPNQAKENGKEKDSKDSVVQARVAANFNELDQLSQEKMSLAERLVEALNRVSARLDHDLGKVVHLSGEQTQEQYEVRNGYVVGMLPGAPAPITLSANTTSISAPVPRSVREVQESLRATMSNELVASASPSPSAGSSQKRRRLNTGAAVASINTNVSSRGHTPQARSRLAQQVHLSPPPQPAASSRSRRLRTPASHEEDEDADADAEGDIDDQDESGDPEDKGLYCYCQKMSYGEMIGCDNENCPYEWFHLGCVGIKAPLPEHWYCDECLKSLGVGGSGSRKGRRKGQ